MDNKILKVKLLTATAERPTRGSRSAAGLDLYADEDFQIAPLSRRLVSTGVAVAIPEGCYGRIAPRSGLAVKHGIDVLAGVVDADYRGEVKVLLYNSDSKELFQAKKGERIAQLILEMYAPVPMEIVDELSDTARSDGGFGSTGV